MSESSKESRVRKEAPGSPDSPDVAFAGCAASSRVQLVTTQSKSRAHHDTFQRIGSPFSQPEHTTLIIAGDEVISLESLPSAPIPDKRERPTVSGPEEGAESERLLSLERLVLFWGLRPRRPFYLSSTASPFYASVHAGAGEPRERR